MVRAQAMVDERNQTIRQEIIDELENNALTVRDISQLVGILEKDVYHHLAFIEKTIKHRKKRMHLEPYYCMNCGFQFKNRKTFKRQASVQNAEIAGLLLLLIRSYLRGIKYH